jgi:hypothetical protein
LCPVAPEAGSSALSSVTHRRASEAMNPRANPRHGRCSTRARLGTQSTALLLE